METIITERISAEVDKLRFGYWDTEAEEFIPIESTEECEEIARRWGVNVEMIYALQMLIGDVHDMVRKDLGDIWKRLDNR